MKRKQTKSRSDEYFRRSTQMKNAKMAASKQNGRLPVGRRKSVQETFLCVLVYSICVPNFVCLRQSGRRGGHFKPAHFPLATPTSEKFRFQHFSPSRTCVPNFMTFHGRLGPQKCICFGRKRKNNLYKNKQALGP